MTVRSKWYGWLPGLDERNLLPIFRRVTKVYLVGPEYRKELLAHLAEFHELQELELWETSISYRELEAWKKQHPQVAVTATHRAITR